MKHTAVEWLEKELNYIEENAYTSYINLKIQQAKEMEKEQMRDASCPYVGGWEDEEFEQYYNKTFKNKDK